MQINIVDLDTRNIITVNRFQALIAQKQKEQEERDRKVVLLRALSYRQFRYGH